MGSGELLIEGMYKVLEYRGGNAVRLLDLADGFLAWSPPPISKESIYFGPELRYPRVEPTYNFYPAEMNL